MQLKYKSLVISDKSFVLKMSAVIDPLGFTKQTEILLYGVRAQNLIQEFKKRNISTDALHKLTKEDLVKLGNIFILITLILYFY